MAIAIWLSDANMCTILFTYLLIYLLILFRDKFVMQNFMFLVNVSDQALPI